MDDRFRLTALGPGTPALAVESPERGACTLAAAITIPAPKTAHPDTTYVERPFEQGFFQALLGSGTVRPYVRPF